MIIDEETEAQETKKLAQDHTEIRSRADLKPRFFRLKV